MSDRFPFEAQLSEFDRIVKQSLRELSAQVEAAVLSGDLSRLRSRVNRLQAAYRVIESMHERINPLALNMVSDAYRESMDRAGLVIARAHVVIPTDVEMLGSVSRDAVEALQRSMEGKITSASERIGRQIDDIYSAEGRRSVLRSLLGVDASPSQASKSLQTALQKDRQIANAVRHSNVGFVDRSGRAWKLDTYANMAVRTGTREAVTIGAANRCAASKVDILRISKHPNSCPICIPHEDTLVSISGKTTEFKGEPVIPDGELPPYHPNCTHNVLPELGTADDIIAALESGEL